MVSKQLLIQLKEDEGFRVYPYHCTGGKLTIGYGRNLEDVGISQDEAEQLLINDALRAQAQCRREFPFFDSLTPARQDVLINMAFNLGIKGLLKFKRTLAHIRNQEYKQAGLEMLNSQWAMQVGNRAARLAALMEKGDY